MKVTKKALNLPSTGSVGPTTSYTPKSTRRNYWEEDYERELLDDAYADMNGTAAVNTYVPTWTPVDPKFVMMLGRTQLYAGSVLRWDKLPFTPDLKVELDSWAADIMENVSANQSARAVLPDTLFEPEVPTMQLKWGDGSIPAIGQNWWMDFRQALVDLPEGSKVIIGCTGGKGRTGTALAILAGLDKAGVWNEFEDPISWVRTVYHEDAVESRLQVLYVEAITEVPIFSNASDNFLGRPAGRVHVG